MAQEQRGIPGRTGGELRPPRRLASRTGYRVAILSSSGKGEVLAAELGRIGVSSRRTLCRMT
ncbi:hypothetical protein MASR1M65_04610 [Saprospiraceae bacterium]